MEKKTFALLLLAITIFLISIFSLIVMNDLRTDSINKRDLNKVTNISIFYTVESCANKYISYLGDKNYEIIYSLLDDNYIEKNHVTKDNLRDYIDFLDKRYNLKLEEMYKYKNSNIYYVKGTLIEEVMDIVNPDKKSFKTTIKLDEEHNKFSIIPDGDGGVIDE